MPALANTELTYSRFVGDASFIKDGAVDIVGDVHGCADELMALMRRTGYVIEPFDPRKSKPIRFSHPEGRRLIFLGDLTDRGPFSDIVLRLAMGGLISGTSSTILGNHDWKLFRLLRGQKVSVSSDLQSTLDQIKKFGQPFVNRVLTFYLGAPHQIRVPLPSGHRLATGDGYITLVHAAAKTHRQDCTQAASFERSLYGYANGEEDASGVLIREDWAQAYEGARAVIHGHTPMDSPREVNRVICIDTGCVFGNGLTMYRLDRDEFLFEKALANYSGKNKLLGSGNIPVLTL